MKKLLSFLVLCSCVGASDLHSLNIDGLLVCEQPDSTELLIQKWTESHQGTLISANRQQWNLRIPQHQTDALIHWIGTQGQWVLQQKQSQSLGARANEIEAQIGNKEKAVEDFLKILSNSSAETFAEVEEEIMTLQADIEQLKAQKRILLRESKFTDFQIRLQTPPKIIQVPTAEISPFPWLQGRGFASLWQDFYGSRLNFTRE